MANSRPPTHPFFSTWLLNDPKSDIACKFRLKINKLVVSILGGYGWENCLLNIVPVDLLIRDPRVDALKALLHFWVIQIEIYLVFSMTSQMIIQIFLLGKHFSTDMTKKSSRASTVIIRAGNQMFIHG